MTTPSPCFPLTREAPSREIVPATVTVTDHAQLPVSPGNPDRRSLLIVNTDAVTSVYIVRNGQGQIGDNSFELAPGSGITLNTAAPVYVVAPAGKTVVVKLLAEMGGV